VADFALDQDDADEAEQERDGRILDRVRAGLAEHFDTVVIMVTRYRQDGVTVAADRASGNWYARMGQVREWLLKTDEQSRREVHAEDD